MNTAVCHRMWAYLLIITYIALHVGLNVNISVARIFAVSALILLKN